jgi:hypothetical protein
VQLIAVDIGMHMISVLRTFRTVGTIFPILCQFYIQVPFSAVSPLSEMFGVHGITHYVYGTGIFEAIVKYKVAVKFDFRIINFDIMLLNIQNWTWLNVTVIKITFKWCYYCCINTS